MKLTLLSSLILMMLILNSCNDSESDSTSKGLHFQGRDCIACHNIDLQKEKHLIIGGTLFKNTLPSNGENLNTLCDEEMIINFLDENNLSKVVHHSISSSSKGNKGKGNFFMLQRENQAISGEYIMQIVNKKGTILAQSNRDHDFNTILINDADPENRYSCNSCHTSEKGGFTTPMISNKNNCQ